MPKLVSAAIKFKPKGCGYFQIMCGKRHCNVLELMYHLRIEYEKATAVQGVLADEDQFGDMRYWSGEKDIPDGTNHKETLNEIRDDVSYDSILFDGKTVWDFFMENANKDIVDVIIKTNYYPICGKNNLCYSVVLPKKKIKSKFLNRIFNFF